MSCPSVVAPEKVLALVEPKQKILFVGSYDISNRNIQNLGITSTLSAEIALYPDGFNLRVVQSFSVNDKNLPNINFLNETYSITSWNAVPLIPLSKIIGEINFTGLYDNGNASGTITANSVQKFNVNSSSGIYSDITDVIIDFSKPLGFRVLYFVGNR